MSTTTIHHVPILLQTLVVGLLTVLVGWKIAALISNPVIYLDPALETAANELAIVCEGKLTSTTLTPPPPGANYIITTCLDKSAATLGSTAFTLYQMKDLIKSGKDFISFFKSPKNNLGTLWKKLGKGLNNLEEVGNLRKPTSDLLDTIGDVGNSIDDVQDALKSLENLPIDNVDEVKKLLTQTDDIKANLKILENYKTAGAPPLDPNSEEYEKIIKAINDLKSQTASLENGLTSFAGGLNKFLKTANNAGTLAAVLPKKSKGLTIFSSKTNKVISSAKTTLLDLSDWQASKNVFKTINHVITSISSGIKKNRKSILYAKNAMKFAQDVSSEKNRQIIDSYLTTNSEVFEILAGSFIGIPYSPLVINIINMTEDDPRNDRLIEFSQSALYVTGDMSSYTRQFRKDSSTFLASRGYYLTSSFINDLNDYEILTYDSQTNINPSIFFRLASEFAIKSKPICEESENCDTYFSDLFEYSVNMNLDTTTLDEFETISKSNNPSIINHEYLKFADVLNFFKEKDIEAGPVFDDAVEVQKEVGSWMGENCETSILNLDEIGPVEVTSCGLVIDCSPIEFCYVGLPVVNADPWIPYIPVTYLDGDEVEGLGNLIGMNYDSTERVITPKWWGGACLTPRQLEHIYICVSLPSFSRCKVVDCGKQLDIEPTRFTPTVTAEDIGEKMEIRGNFATW